MNEKPNLSSQQFDALLKAAAGSSGADADKMKSAIESGNVNGLLGSLRPEDSAKVQKILSDKGAVEKLLATPKAQEFLKKFLGK